MIISDDGCSSSSCSTLLSETINAALPTVAVQDGGQLLTSGGDRFHDGDGDQDLFLNLIKLPPEPQTVFTDCVIVFVASNLTFMFKTVRMPL